ncbi:unnamed protein product, partial [Urochloa humidicola]
RRRLLLSFPNPPLPQICTHGATPSDADLLSPFPPSTSSSSHALPTSNGGRVESWVWDQAARRTAGSLTRGMPTSFGSIEELVGEQLWFPPHPTREDCLSPLDNIKHCLQSRIRTGVVGIEARN